jgi:hypothetical protein
MAIRAPSCMVGVMYAERQAAVTARTTVSPTVAFDFQSSNVPSSLRGQ